MQQLISTLFKGRKNIMWMVSHWPNFPTFFGIHQAMTEQRKWCCNVLIQWTLNQQKQEDAEGTAVISNQTYKAINSWVGNCELAIFITIKVTSVILIKDHHHIIFFKLHRRQFDIKNHTYKAIYSWVGNRHLAIISRQLQLLSRHNFKRLIFVVFVKSFDNLPHVIYQPWSN